MPTTQFKTFATTTGASGAAAFTQIAGTHQTAINTAISAITSISGYQASYTVIGNTTVNQDTLAATWAWVTGITYITAT